MAQRRRSFHSFFALSFSTVGLYLSLAERQIFWTPLAPLSFLASRILTLSNHGTGVARFDWNAVHVCFSYNNSRTPKTHRRDTAPIHRVWVRAFSGVSSKKSKGSSRSRQASLAPVWDRIICPRSRCALCSTEVGRPGNISV